jgi:hypothetical protein
MSRAVVLGPRDKRRGLRVLRDSCGWRAGKNFLERRCLDLGGERPIILILVCK